MTIKRPPPSGRPLIPDQIYRPKEWPAFLGVGYTQIYEMIKDGEIPPPLKLRKRGRAVGYLGSTLIAHQKKLSK